MLLSAFRYKLCFGVLPHLYKNYNNSQVNNNTEKMTETERRNAVQTLRCPLDQMVQGTTQVHLVAEVHSQEN